MATYRAKVADGGRLVIPAEIRHLLGFQPGAELVLDIRDGELWIRSVRQAVEQAQMLVRRRVGKGSSLADELIAERREASRRE